MDEHMKKLLLFIGLAGLFFLTSCNKDFLDTDNKEFVSAEQLEELAASSPEALLAVSEGILGGSYSYLREFNTWADGGGRHDDFGQKSIDLGLDLMSNDAVQVVDHWFGNYYSYRGRTEPFSTTHVIWNFYYSIIKNMNDIIAFIPEDVEEESLLYVKGRALSLRGMSYFNLVRVYQHTYSENQGAAGVPIYDGTSFDGQPRSSVQEVYDQVLTDLQEAYTLLEGYARPAITDVDQSVVAGLLARVYLEMEDYANAADMANQARQGYPLMSNDDWLGGFSNINNAEWMWGADIDAETSTIYASFFSHMGNLDPGYAGLLRVYKAIDARLYDAIPDTDVRKAAFAGDNDPSGLPKYANKKFYDLVSFFEGDYLYMRAAEMYLIEAEALANSGDEAGAKQVLFELISPRDPNYTLSANSGQALLDEIYLHRRIELWGEGFAWYDQKRLGVDLVREYAGSNHPALGNFNFAYNANEMIYQIPEDEINANDQINDADQNPL
jgi:hypothetical protein